MAAVKLKPLYMAKDMKELNKKVSNEKMKSAAPKTLCRLADKIYLKARDAALSGDEEEAYVLFMRFYEVFNAIKGSREYRSNKTHFDRQVPMTKVLQALEESEKLSASLRERYLTLSEPVDKKAKLETETSEGDEPGGKIARGNEDSNDQVVPPSLEQPRSAHDIYKQQTKVDDLDSLFGGCAAEPTASQVTVKPPSLVRQQLYDILQQSPDDILVLDCRPRASYIASHVDTKKFPQWVGVPEEMVKKGVTTESVVQFLRGKQKRLWGERGSKKWVVLLDEGSKVTELSSTGGDNVPILALKDAIHKWDTSVPLVREPFILDGGYSMWYLAYSPLCVGVPRRLEKEEMGGASLGKEPVSMEYPTLIVPEMISETKDEDTTAEETQTTATPPPSDPPLPPPSSPSPSAPTLPILSHPSAPTLPHSTASTLPHLLPTPLPAPHISPTPPFQPFAPHLAPPPPPSVPPLLSLEGEATLLTPMLSSDDDILANLKVSAAIDPPDSDHSDAYGKSGIHYEPPSPAPIYHGGVSRGGGDSVVLTSDPSYHQAGPHAGSHPHVGEMPQYPSHWNENNSGMGAVHPQDVTAGGYTQLGTEQRALNVAPSVPSHGYLASVDGSTAHPASVVQTTPSDFQPVAQQLLPTPNQTFVTPPHPINEQGQPSPPSHQQLRPVGPHVATHPDLQPHHYQHGTDSQATPMIGSQYPQTASTYASTTVLPHQHSYPAVQGYPHPSSQIQGPPPSQSQVLPPSQPPQGYSHPPSHIQGYHQPPSEIRDTPPSQSQGFPPSQPLQAYSHPPSQSQGYSQPHSQTQGPPHSQTPKPPHFQPPQSQGYSQPLSQIQGHPHSQTQNPTHSQPPQSQGAQAPFQPLSQNQGPPVAQLSPGSQADPNPRVTNGPIPNPPSYDYALTLPSQPPIQPPIPPPISNAHPAAPSNQPYQVLPPVPVQQQQPPHHSFDQSRQSVATEQGDLVTESQREADAKIRILEERLAAKERDLEEQKERSERSALQQRDQETQALEQAAMMREQLEREKALVLEAARQQQSELAAEKERLRLATQQEREQVKLEMERQRQALAAERDLQQRLLENRERSMSEMQAQMERERASMMHHKEELMRWELRKQQETKQKTFSLNQGLPPKWEKRLDTSTGRFYYVDHSTKTTHWDPPTNWLNYQAELQRQKDLQQQQQTEAAGQLPTVAQPHQPQGARQQVSRPAAPSPATQGGTPPLAPAAVPPLPKAKSVAPTDPSSSLPPSQTTKPATAPQTTEVSLQPVQPSVDRSMKPPPAAAKQPAVDRSNKPTMNPVQYRRKLEGLQPVFGSMDPGLTGLRNLGNTCFLNSIVQCLSSTTPLAQYLISGRYRNDVNRYNPLGHGGIVAEEFAFVVKNLWCGQFRSISPRDFKDMTYQMVNTFVEGVHQDSHEFLAFLVDGLHEDLNRIAARRVETAKKEEQNLPDHVAAEVAWRNHRERNNSIIVDLFQGQLRSAIICRECRWRSVTFEAFMYLNLPLPSSTSCSLQDCVHLFTKEERVSGENKWSCPKCKKHVEAVKRIDIWKLPPILMIPLKRFSYQAYKGNSMWRKKNQALVDFPLSSFDLTSHVVGVKPTQRYNLYAVSNHYGTMEGGHYTAYCVNPYKRKFYNYDDNVVKEILPRQVKTAAAYVLFYTSVDLTPPKLFTS